VNNEIQGSENRFQFETKGSKAVQQGDKVVCIEPQATTKKRYKSQSFLDGLQVGYCDICKVEVFQSESKF